MTQNIFYRNFSSIVYIFTYLFFPRLSSLSINFQMTLTHKLYGNFLFTQCRLIEASLIIPQPYSSELSKNLKESSFQVQLHVITSLEFLFLTVSFHNLNEIFFLNSSKTLTFFSIFYLPKNLYCKEK